MFGDSDESDGEQPESRPPTCGVLAFHNGTEEAMLLYVERTATKNDPRTILAAIDKFCYTRHWMMNIGTLL